MKSKFALAAVAATLCWTTMASAQVAVKVNPNPTLAPANNLDPVPAAPLSPTPNGENRAIRREERRIDRTGQNGNLAPEVQPNGAVTATPNPTGNTVTPRTSNYRAPNNYTGRTYRRGLFGRRAYSY